MVELLNSEGTHVAETACARAQVLEGVSGPEEVADLGRLLGFLGAELAANRNFEFAQALLRLTLQARPARARGGRACERALAERRPAGLASVVASWRVARL